jgi:hypothetical protein
MHDGDLSVASQSQRAGTANTTYVMCGLLWPRFLVVYCVTGPGSRYFTNAHARPPPYSESLLPPIMPHGWPLPMQNLMVKPAAPYVSGSGTHEGRRTLGSTEKCWEESRQACILLWCVRVVSQENRSWRTAQRTRLRGGARRRAIPAPIQIPSRPAGKPRLLSGRTASAARRRAALGHAPAWRHDLFLSRPCLAGASE